MKKIRLNILLLSVASMLLATNSIAQLAGNYTIDPAMAASATNYLDFTSAAEDLHMGSRPDGGPAQGPGLSAAVIIDVATGNYNENVKIYDYAGSSATNTVTFQSMTNDSSDVIVEFSPSSAFQGGVPLYLDAAQHMRFRHMTFINNSSVNGKVVDARNSVSYCEFTDCAFIGLSGSSDYVFHFANTLCDLLGGCPAPGYAADNLIENCSILNGNVGLFFEKQGGADFTRPNGNIVRNNKILDFNGRGMVIAQGTGITIEGNTMISELSAPGILGILFNSFGEEKIVIRNNDIQIDGLSGGFFPPVCIFMNGDFENATSEDSLIIENNFLSTRSDVTAQGLRMSGVDSTQVLINNNSFRIDGSNGPWISADIEIRSPVVTHANYSIQNNNFGNYQMGVAVSFVDSNDCVKIMDHNNYDILSDSLIVYDSLGVVELNVASWNTNTGFGVGSLEEAAGYLSAVDLHTNNCGLFMAGVDLTTVSNDIDGLVRPSPPTIGAAETTDAPTATVNKTICEGQIFNYNGTNYTTTGTFSQNVPGSNPFCDSLVTINLSVVSCASIEEDNQHILFYPNPVNESLTIVYSNLIEGDAIVIYDASGRSVRQLFVNTDEGKVQIPLESLSPGTYFLQVGNLIEKVTKL